VWSWGCATEKHRGTRHFDARSIQVLNGLRNEINSHYGFREGVPRVNLGPCGRVARDFRAQWNERFDEKISVVFVMSPDGSECYHVLVKLPDGNYFDGGNGVMEEKDLLSHYPDGHIEEMKDFDFKLLDKRSYDLGRTYPVCPNYSDAMTRELITRYLGRLADR